LAGRTLTTSDGLTGTVSADGKTIDWNINIRWVKEPAAPTSAPASPLPAGSRVCDVEKERLCASFVQGQIPWSLDGNPSYRVWDQSNVDALCRCTTNAAATVRCFQDELVRNGGQLKGAIDTCTAR
jgi:hypothetical protein